MNIYLAGKIRPSDWRAVVVPESRKIIEHGETGRWPVLGGMFGQYYTGPFFQMGHLGFVVCQTDHNGLLVDLNGKALVDEDGEFMTSSGHDEAIGRGRPEVVKLCLQAIRNSHLFFAWMDDDTAYGTLAEIGFAKGINVPIVLGTPPGSQRPRPSGERGQVDPGGIMSDLWFAFEMATHIVEAIDPVTALRQAINFYNTAPPSLRWPKENGIRTQR